MKNNYKVLFDNINSYYNMKKKLKLIIINTKKKQNKINDYLYFVFNA